MPIELGSGFKAPYKQPTQEVAPPPGSVEGSLLRLEETVHQLNLAIQGNGTPEIHVDAPDLTDIVNAVNSLRPGATATDIAEAIKLTMIPADVPDSNETLAVLTALKDTLEKLEFRNQATQAFGGGSVTMAPGQIVDVNVVSGGGGGGGSSGGLTNTELRATPVPVSGAFFQATQPVSIAVAVPVTDNGGSLTVDGVFWQATQPVSVAGTITVSGPLTDAQLRATPVPVSGTVTANTGLSQPLTDTQVRATPLPVSGTVTATGPLTDTQLRAVPVPVSGTVTITDGSGPVTVDGTVAVSGSVSVTGTFFQATQPVSGAFFQATQPVSIAGSVTVSGPLTDTQIRATPLPVSGTLTVNTGLTDTQLRATPVPVSGTVTANTGLTQPLTDTQLRATAVPVSGTVTATGPLTDTQIRATALPISGTVTATGPLTDAQLRASAVPVVGTQPTGTLTNGAETAVSSSAVQILAANASRKKVMVQNTGLFNIRVGVSGVAATTGLQIIPNGTLILDSPNCPVQALFAIREGSSDSIALAMEIV